MDGGSIAVPLTVLFVILKLVGVISWSWWWVFSPILISLGLGVLGVVLFLFIALIMVKVLHKDRPSVRLPGPAGRLTR